jgi:hypothetical protein
MSLEFAIRLTEILLALAFIQQSLEHLYGRRDEKILFTARLILSVFVLLGIGTSLTCLGLLLISLLILHRFDGPYNGGSDRMGLLILCCLCFSHFAPVAWQEYGIAYLAIQSILSYFIAGWVKVINPDWRSGRALHDVFTFSAYPVSESVRLLAEKPRLLHAAGWVVIVFELLFPVTMLTQSSLVAGLIVATIFHTANAFLFGLNRFLWVWIAAYPSIFWLQQRLFDV